MWINAIVVYDPAFGTDRESEELEKLLNFGATVI